MRRRRLLVLVSIVAFSGIFVLFRTMAPARYDTVRAEWQDAFGGVPEPVMMGGMLLWVVVVWIATMVLLAKALYWLWCQVDEYVFWLWNTVLPESPAIRLGAGITIMIFVFVFGPLVVLQGTDFLGDDDSVEDRLETNQSDAPTNSTATDEDTETNTPTNSTEHPDEQSLNIHFSTI